MVIVVVRRVGAAKVALCLPVLVILNVDLMVCAMLSHPVANVRRDTQVAIVP